MEVIQRQTERIEKEEMDWWYSDEEYFEEEVESMVMDPRRGGKSPVNHPRLLNHLALLLCCFSRLLEMVFMN